VGRLPSNLPIDGHSYRRVEVLTGSPRRRHWSLAEKASIVAESFAPGAVTSTIALRHGLHRNQLYAWRRELRSAMVADAGIPEFVPVVAESRVAPIMSTVEIEIGGATVRLGLGVDLAFLAEIIRVLKASA
jgi:transposase